ncbi:HEAT repeat domain-containing protein [Aeoliella mucimassa]|uniref:HEAT repeat protein n=1 Tax=Aeoliella mucimassa TaxID=2527972 RepID=A0A518ANH6_9BACT|nr:HEAT repeat domain-containing protein [Aeoliella mucimassa]QDU56277.1 HEAT repeat protein [Aeoliella mucimassa]
MSAIRFHHVLALAALLLPVAAASQAQSTDAPAAQSTESTELTSREAAVVEQLDQLLSRPGVVKERAARRIGRALDSKSIAIRWRAARVAGRLGLDDAETIAKLQAGVADDSWLVQLHSIAALTNLGDKSDATVDALTTAALSDNARVAIAAIKALRALEVDPAKAASTMNKVLAGENQAVATHAVEAMVEAGPKAVPFLKEALKQPNAAFWACVAIADLGPDAAEVTPELAEYLQSIDKVESAPQALLAVAEIGPAASAAEPAIVAVMNRWKDDKSIQLTGMYALGAIEASDSDQLLTAGSNSDDPFTAMVASWAMAKIHPDNKLFVDAAVLRLVGGLESDQPTVRQAAAHGLVTLHLPPGTAAPYLIKAAKNPVARDHIADALATLGPDVVPHAARAMANPESRPLALEVLSRLGTDAAGATEALAASLQDSTPLVRQRTCSVLAQIGPKAAPATKELAVLLNSQDGAVRHSAMYALREIGPKAENAKGALLGKLKSSDPANDDTRFDRFAAAWTLARVAPSDPTVVTAVLPVLSEGITSDTLLERSESIVAASDLGPAAKPLKEALTKAAESDADLENREAAQAVLESLE